MNLERWKRRYEQHLKCRAGTCQARRVFGLGKVHVHRIGDVEKEMTMSTVRRLTVALVALGTILGTAFGAAAETPLDITLGEYLKWHTVEQTFYVTGFAAAISPFVKCDADFTMGGTMARLQGASITGLAQTTEKLNLVLLRIYGDAYRCTLDPIR